MSRNDRGWSDAADFAGAAAEGGHHKLVVLPGDLSCSCGGWRRTYAPPLSKPEMDALLAAFAEHLNGVRP